ncbi:MAG: hypothetical protein K6B68_17615 [Eubacterium sp.]|nr:hypothetical protein [Eubacterium sp.]
MNIRAITLYELRKILKSKLTFAIMVMSFAVVIITGLDLGGDKNYIIDSQSDINGRKIDDELLAEMYENIDAYGENWSDDNAKYRQLASFEKKIVGSGEKLSNYKADDLYDMREGTSYNAFEHGIITEGEYSWWERQEDKVENPFTYYYNRGLVLLANGIGVICVLLLFSASISLSTVFSREKRDKTDQIILCTRYGRKTMFISKIIAGLIFFLIYTTLLFVVLVCLVLVTKGLDGADSILQLEHPWVAYPFTFGEFCTKETIIVFTASILFAVVSMVFSLMFGRGLAVTGMMIGVFLTSGIITIPDRLRMLGHMRDLLPTNLSSIYSTYNFRLIGFGNHYITDYQFAPVLYIVLSVVLLFIGGMVYRRYQINGK